MLGSDVSDSAASPLNDVHLTCHIDDLGSRLDLLGEIRNQISRTERLGRLHLALVIQVQRKVLWPSERMTTVIWSSARRELLACSRLTAAVASNARMKEAKRIRLRLFMGPFRSRASVRMSSIVSRVTRCLTSISQQAEPSRRSLIPHPDLNSLEGAAQGLAWPARSGRGCPHDPFSPNPWNGSRELVPRARTGPGREPSMRGPIDDHGGRLRSQVAHPENEGRSQLLQWRCEQTADQRSAARVQYQWPPHVSTRFAVRFAEAEQSRLAAPQEWMMIRRRRLKGAC